MFVEQLSVFVENCEGRLEQVTEVLREQDINILSLNMTDTMGYGTLRTIVSDPDKAKTALREKGFSAMLTDVLVVKLEGQVGELHKMIRILCSRGLNIEYMCVLVSANRKVMIMKASDGEIATRAVTDGGLALCSNGEMCW